MPPVKIIILAVISALLMACKGSDNDVDLPVINGCEIDQQSQFVKDVLLDQYLWYRDVDATLNVDNLDSPNQALELLIDRDQDRFSGIDNAANFDSLFSEGQYLGYGFSFKVASDSRVLIQFIYDDSPTGRSDIQRGDEILSINGQTVQEVIDAAAWDTVFGPNTQGHPLRMVLRNTVGNEFEVFMQKTTVNINTVLHHSVIDNGIENVGYLVFKSFLSPSNNEFPAVFEDFRTAGVRKLVLDLRYNGGGSVSVANNLASYLYADSSSQELFAKLLHNDKQQFRNSSFYLNSALNKLNLTQLIVITSAATCSASEMMINGLKPFIDVKTVGSKTCGKPVGMNGFRFCDNILLPVTFEIRNQSNEGNYFDGIAADCAAEDDVSFNFGNTSEPMLDEALYLSRENSCQSASRPQQVSTQIKKFEPVVRTVIGAQ